MQYRLLFLFWPRYISICRHSTYDKIFSKRKLAFYILFIYVWGCLNNVANIAGWGGFSYDLKSLTCVWNRLASRSYSIFIICVGILIPSGFILFFYLKIFIHVSKSTNKIGAYDSSTSTHTMKKSVKIAKCLFLSFLTFGICW